MDQTCIIGRVVLSNGFLIPKLWSRNISLKIQETYEWHLSSVKINMVLHLTFGSMFESLQLFREENFNICIQTCLLLYYSTPTLCSGRARGPFDLSLSNHAWFCCGLSALVTLGLIHDTGSSSFVFSFPCSFGFLWLCTCICS